MQLRPRIGAAWVAVAAAEIRSSAECTRLSSQGNIALQTGECPRSELLFVRVRRFVLCSPRIVTARPRRRRICALDASARWSVVICAHSRRGEVKSAARVSWCVCAWVAAVCSSSHPTRAEATRMRSHGADPQQRRVEKWTQTERERRVRGHSANDHRGGAQPSTTDALGCAIQAALARAHRGILRSLTPLSLNDLTEHPTRPPLCTVQHHCNAAMPSYHRAIACALSRDASQCGNRPILHHRPVPCVGVCSVPLPPLRSSSHTCICRARCKGQHSTRNSSGNSEASGLTPRHSAQ